jgi:hypothetical protein
MFQLTNPTDKKQRELEEQKKKYEEFWSDPCWTEPLEEDKG